MLITILYSGFNIFKRCLKMVETDMSWDNYAQNQGLVIILYLLVVLLHRDWIFAIEREDKILNLSLENTFQRNK